MLNKPVHNQGCWIRGLAKDNLGKGKDGGQGSSPDPHPGIGGVAWGSGGAAVIRRSGCLGGHEQGGAGSQRVLKTSGAASPP